MTDRQAFSVEPGQVWRSNCGHGPYEAQIVYVSDTEVVFNYGRIGKDRRMAARLPLRAMQEFRSGWRPYKEPARE